MNVTKLFYGQLKRKEWSLYLVATKEGLCYVGSENKGVEEINNWAKMNHPNATLVEDFSIVEQFATELEEYMNGKRKSFDIEIVLQGTPFQEAVWTELQSIPFGETRSYSDIAKKIGNPKAVRAVGSAIGANPIPIVVPCHRVISKSGKLSGFRGGVEMKKKLLALEGICLS